MTSVIDTEDMMVGAYWPARAGDSSACARVLIRAVDAIATIDPRFAELWYGRDSPRQPARRFVGSPEAVARTLEAIGRVADESTSGYDPVLGFVCSVDEGKRRLRQGRIRLICGSTSEWISNSLTLELPEDPHPTLPSHEWLRASLVALIEASSPRWARVDSYRRVEADWDFVRPSMGWMLYLADVRPDRLPRLPNGATAEILGDGVLITTMTDTFDFANPDHRQLAADATRALDRAGLLRP